MMIQTMLFPTFYEDIESNPIVPSELPHRHNIAFTL
jgi:hypothetical protein